VTAPPPDDGESERRRGNIAALIAVVVLAALGYWAFTAIEHMRKLQECLAEERRDCVQIDSSGR
jgi:hypothetical protein